MQLLRTHGTPAIVYVGRCKYADELSCNLRAELTDKVVETYHGSGANPDPSKRHKVDPSERRRVQKGFLEGSVDVIVATKAFGLGINKRGVRTIIHDGPPGDLNGYVQEMGRAGRGETPAWCILLCSSRQLTACERDGSAAPKTARFREILDLDGCRWAFLRESFGESSRHALPSLRPACTPAPPVPLVPATPDGDHLTPSAPLRPQQRR